MEIQTVSTTRLADICRSCSLFLHVLPAVRVSEHQRYNYKLTEGKNLTEPSCHPTALSLLFSLSVYMYKELLISITKQ